MSTLLVAPSGFDHADLAAKTVELARRNEALEDFAALVAHELKAPLHGVLTGGDPVAEATRALDLVDEILEASRASVDRAGAPVADCLALALRDLAPLEVAVESSLIAEAPVPGAALRLLLRNLIGNARAAGARRIRVATTASDGRWTLRVEDDGVGLEADTYSVGSRIGLGLCRRMAERFGGTIDLEPRVGGGTCALLVVDRRAR